MTGKVVIVGAGQAGAQAAVSLRGEGFRGSITLVGEEPGLPYQRPPLSKAYLLGEIERDRLLLKPATVYRESGVTLVEGVAATALDRRRRRVVLADGSALEYDRLVLATGARQRSLSVPGAELEGILHLRSLADADALMARFGKARRALIIGAGFIGLEFAAVARKKGLDVVVVEAAERVMGRVLSREMTSFFESRHREWGSEFRFGTGIARFHGEGGVAAAELENGDVIEADLVLVGIGVTPNQDLAEAAGLEVSGGIAVDRFLRTSDPAIYAIGDCACFPSSFCGGSPVRIESVQNSIDHARLVAANIMGSGKPYDAVPWFWSDQGDQRLQIAGIGAGHDRTVLRGDPRGGAFSVFCYRGQRLLAVESVNRGADHVVARRLIAAGCSILPEDAANESVPLKSLLVRAT